MANKFYITTPIYYVNDIPHIGHSYTTIAADTLARFNRRLLGEQQVWFLTGTDEHGQKIQKASDEAKLTPQEFVDKVVVKFRELWVKLDISYNDFIRTTEERHIKVVQKALEILYKSGDIYEDTYEGWYCTPCETFWPQTQLVDHLCPDCHRPVEKISEKNFFLKLEKYQQDLIKHIEEHKNFIRPDFRRNEVLSFLRLNKLDDLCISRPKERLSWGIPLTFSPGHVTYVWFDALINYMSAVGSFDEKNNYVSSWWGSDTEVVHLIGKDILRHHAVYWPIMLMALQQAGVKGVKLPDTIFAHGWWLNKDEKMSKSRGNVISPLAMADKFGVETYRYFLLRDLPFGLDGNFSEEAFIKRFNSDLANDLGNLVYRTLTMVEKYFQGAVPEFSSPGERVKEIAALLAALPQEVKKSLKAESDFNFVQALEKIWEKINLANKYVEETKPWNLAKENKTEELKNFIRLLVEAIRKTGAEIAPFMPHTAGTINEELGSSTVKKGKPLFPRIEDQR